MKKVPRLSVFFPAYNEAENIETIVKTALKILRKAAKKFEIIVVDDGSTDATKLKVEDLAEKNKEVRLICHPKNLGYGAALRTGMYASRFPLICYTDSDGQFDFREIKKFLSKIKSADLVLGFRIKRTDKLYRRILAKILWLADWVLFGLDVEDVDCGFKLFKKEVLEKIGLLKTSSAITETEFVVRAKRAGFKIAQVGVRHHSRQEGKQTGGKIKVILKAAVEGIKLWWLFQKEKKNG